MSVAEQRYEAVRAVIADGETVRRHVRLDAHPALARCVLETWFNPARTPIATLRSIRLSPYPTIQVS
jgi:hypothetical protein